LFSILNAKLNDDFYSQKNEMEPFRWGSTFEV
jgi:hypothetical protein